MNPNESPTSAPIGICHICGFPNAAPGAIFCSGAHPRAPVQVPTPRTDTEAVDLSYDGKAKLEGCYVALSFARQLERELAATTERLANAEAKYRSLLHSDEICLAMARADGWREDTSPETEISNHDYWWNDGLLERLHEDSLIDHYCDMPVPLALLAKPTAAERELDQLREVAVNGAGATCLTELRTQLAAAERGLAALKAERVEVMKMLNDAAREANHDGYDYNVELWRNFSSHLDRYKAAAQETIDELKTEVGQVRADANIHAHRADVLARRLDSVDDALKLALPEYDRLNTPASQAVGALHERFNNANSWVAGQGVELKNLRAQVATLTDQNALMRQDLKEITAALDMPEADLTLTLAECVAKLRTALAEARGDFQRAARRCGKLP